MKLSQFKFRMPDELIALNPPMHRDECKLMILHRKSQTIDLFKKDEEGNLLDGSEYEVEKKVKGKMVKKTMNRPKEYLDFRNVLEHFDEGDTFIFNDTKVFPHAFTARRKRPTPR